VRVINISYQTTDENNTVATAEPRAIDFLFDGSTNLPGQSNIPANSIFPVQTENPQDNYVNLSQGIHTFSARLAPPATPNTPLFTNGASPLGEYIPKLFFTGDTYYTIIVGGVAPTTGMPNQNAFLPTLGPGADYPLVDDNTPPPKANGQYMARFRFVNAAVFGLNGSVDGSTTASLFITEGHNLPSQAEIALMRSSASATFRKARTSSSVNPYVNVLPGDYVITVTVAIGGARTIIAQLPVTLASGEVRSFILMNTGYASTPSPANHRLISVLDAKF
jgi:hypothetical protein